MFRELSHELRRPSTVIAVVISFFSVFIGIITSIYFYQKSVNAGIIYYNVVQVLAFDQKNLQNKEVIIPFPVAVVDGDGRKISGNIYVANLEIWNGGNDDIRKEDIRIPYKIVLNDSAKIINASIYGQSSNNVDLFSISTDYTISWSNFDPGEHFNLRIIYSTDDIGKVSIVGRSIKSGEPKDIAKIKERYNKIPEIASLVFYGATLFAMGIAVVGLVVTVVRQIRTNEVDLNVVLGYVRSGIMQLIVGLLIIVTTAMVESGKIWLLLGVVPVPPP